MEALVQVIKNMGIVRLALMGALLAGLISGVTFISNKMTAPDLTLLYGDLELEDAGKIASRLEAQGVPVEVRAGGTQIYAPADRVTRLRVELAEAGLPRGGSVGYEIFDKGDQLGVSSFVQNINQLRALEGELSRTITSIAQISAARVHLVLPKRKLFSREKDEPTASIMLTMAGPGTLSSRRVQAIRQLVAAAVPGLAPEHVSIVDDRGNLLAKGDDDTASSLSANLEEKRLAYENRLSRTIESLVSKYVGDGKVRAEVAVDMSFDKVTENSESFDPEGQVTRSTQTVSLGEKSHETEPSVSVAKNLPNANANAGASGSENQLNRSEETVNYEVSKKIRTLVKEVGEVKKLSVAVLVDGVYTPIAGKKEMDYKPRSKEEIDSLTKLIKNAVGFDEKRGDSIEVANMRFAPMEMFESEAPAGTILGLEKHDLMHLAEIFLIGILGLVGILFGVKPMVNRVMSGVPGASLPAANQSYPGLAGGEMAALPGAPGVAGALPGPNGEGEGQQVDEFGHLSDGLKELEHMVSLKQVEGAVRASSLKTVGDIITENPESAVGVIRGWLAEDDKKGRA